MNELKPRIHDEKTGIDYVLVGDYYLPEIAVPQESRPIGKWGSLHRAYLKEHRPAVYTSLCLTGRLHTYGFFHFRDRRSSDAGDRSWRRSRRVGRHQPAGGLRQRQPRR